MKNLETRTSIRKYAQREVSILTDAETFTYSFKLGAKIMLDVLTDSPMKEI